MEAINKILPFGLKVQKLVPFFIVTKLVSFAGFATLWWSANGSETFRIILLTIFIPFAGYKVYKFFKKLYKLSEPSFKEKLEKIFKIWFN